MPSYQPQSPSPVPVNLPSICLRCSEYYTSNACFRLWTFAMPICDFFHSYGASLSNSIQWLAGRRVLSARYRGHPILAAVPESVRPKVGSLRNLYDMCRPKPISKIGQRLNACFPSCLLCWDMQANVLIVYLEWIRVWTDRCFGDRDTDPDSNGWGRRQDGFAGYP